MMSNGKKAALIIAILGCILGSCVITWGRLKYPELTETELFLRYWHACLGTTVCAGYLGWSLEGSR